MQTSIMHDDVKNLYMLVTRLRTPHPPFAVKRTPTGIEVHYYVYVSEINIQTGEVEMGSLDRARLTLPAQRREIICHEEDQKEEKPE